MSSIFSKLKDFVGLNEGVEYEYYEEEPDVETYQNLYQEQNPQPAPQETVNRESTLAGTNGYNEYNRCSNGNKTSG